jgi:lysozyme
MSPRNAGSVLILLALSLVARADNSVLSLSHYDERTSDFAAMQRSGLGGIIHEATYPNEADAKYAWRQSQAMRSGLLWGAYHFGNGTDGRRQADQFLSVVGSSWSSGHNPADPQGVLLVLDAEHNTHYPGGNMGVGQALQFIERVHERTGVYPGLYSNENWLKKVFGDPSLSAGARETLRKCFLWVANYHQQPRSVTPWDRWMLWQYTGDGVCQLPRKAYPTSFGAMHKVERTIFAGDRTSLRHFWADHAWLPEKPKDVAASGGQ